MLKHCECLYAFHWEPPALGEDILIVAMGGSHDQIAIVELISRCPLHDKAKELKETLRSLTDDFVRVCEVGYPIDPSGSNAFVQADSLLLELENG